MIFSISFKENGGRSCRTCLGYLISQPNLLRQFPPGRNPRHTGGTHSNVTCHLCSRKAQPLHRYLCELFPHLRNHLPPAPRPQLLYCRPPVLTYLLENGGRSCRTCLGYLISQPNLLRQFPPGRNPRHTGGTHSNVTCHLCSRKAQPLHRYLCELF